MAQKWVRHKTNERIMKLKIVKISENGSAEAFGCMLNMLKNVNACALNGSVKRTNRELGALRVYTKREENDAAN